MLVICGTTFVFASTIFDFKFCTPTFKNIKQLTSSAGSLEVAASVTPYSANFVADLIYELQTKFPHAVITLAPDLQHNGTMRIWIGGLLYVDDLALMSTRELQAVLHVCQEWSVGNCM